MKAILGTLLDGDLHAMTARGPRGPLGRTRMVGMTWDQLTRHTVILGGTGTGKTVTMMRLVSSVMATNQANHGEPGIRVIFVDAKGLDGPAGGHHRQAFMDLAEQHHYLGAYSWPEIALRGLDGDTHTVRERLSGLFRGEESPYHHAEAVTMLDLALHATHPPRTLAELLERVRPGVTAALYDTSGTSHGLDQKKIAASFTTGQWNSLYLRLRALQATIGTTLDSKPLAWSLPQCDAAWVSLPGTTSPQTTADVAAWILALIAELAAHPDGRRTLIVLDEYSAIAHDPRASQAATGLIERTRSAGVAIVLGTQTVASLGESANRILQTAGTTIAHRTPIPDQIIELAGTTQAWEDTQSVDGFGVRTATSGRLQQQYRARPELVRSLPVGEAVVIHAGRWAHIAVAEGRRSGRPREGWA